MTADEVGLLILAGGRSERFGEEDKLLAELKGMPLGLHIAHQMVGFNWGARIVVASEALAIGVSKLGYTIVPTLAGGGMGDNIAQGVKALDAVKAVLIVLADMPYVSGRHIEAIVNAGSDEHSIVASVCEGHASPPVLFGKSCFDELAMLKGDTGARQIISDRGAQVTWIEASQGELLDIDTQVDLQRAIHSQSGGEK